MRLDLVVGVHIVKYNGMRMLKTLVHKCVLGPESSSGKLCWSASHRAFERAMHPLGRPRESR